MEGFVGFRFTQPDLPGSLSFWDSLIVAAALLGEATILYSEDMQTGLAIHDQLTIVNPFTVPANSSS